MDIKELTIQSALEGFQKKKFTVVDVVRACLANIQKYNDDYHALLTVVDEKTLLCQAEKIDKTDYSLPLSGIPIVLKDLFTTTGLRTTAGSKVLEHYTPVYDATVVARLKAAGAIIIGKANQDAWGHGSSGENTDYIPAKNPYDPSRVPGGSSSGSAVAVALGMCLASTGTDTGSSVRGPAAFCNLVGLKPTYGRVSRYGIIAMASSFDTIGHITKTVYDNALMCEITAGKDAYDATTGDQQVPTYSQGLDGTLRGKTIGLPKEYFELKGMDPRVRDATQAAIKKMEDLGARVIEVSLPHTTVAMACYYILVPSEVSSNLARFDGVRFGCGRETFGLEAKRRVMIGTYALSSGYYDAYYQTAAKIRTLIKKDFDDVFTKVDAIVAPSSPTLPFTIGERSSDPVAMYLSDIFMCPVNISGVPAVNVPCGFVGDLPVGLQIIGPQFGEQNIYQIASVYEKATEWYKRTTPV
ncbi:MAG: Asp-tRNA(Asn)/Glu-tRNA(Gln) amidotransferase subunit GatA [Candidatus Gottesmanbacteria bacterium]|nr:Asp-tRNA(Asn)/Glu-tRNA(Gln) amidotransferase subunit GatA [Candidatus Gottesmanbacteria bacterium]